MTLFHSCDGIFQGTREWICIEAETVPGKETPIPIIVNNIDQIEGYGCLSVTVPLGIWNAYHSIRNGSAWPGNMDFTAEPILRFRIMQRNTPSPRVIKFGITWRDAIYSGWHGHGYGDIGSGVPLGEWVEYEFDLRMALDGPVPPNELEKVAQVFLVIEAYTAGVEVLVDGFETLPAITPAPLYLKLEPESAMIDEGTLLTLAATPYGGSPPYTIKWLVDGTPVQEGTGTTYIFYGASSGNYLVEATVIDSLGATYSAKSTIIVLPPVPPPEPCRPIHVSGNRILTDRGKQIHLHGATVEGFADSPNGNWLTKDGVWHWGIGGAWNPQYMREHLEGLRTWGATCTRTHLVVELWIKNIDSTIEKYKEFLAIAQSIGIYVIVEFSSVRSYGQPGAVPTPIPYPPHLNVEEQAMLDAAVGHPWTDKDFVDYYAWFANELRAFPNVIFEFWNEPHGDDAAEATWFDVSQRIINAIRAQGITNIIITQWDYNMAIAYNAPTPAPGNIVGGTPMDWAFDHPLTDPLNNLIYSTHIYRYYGGPGWYSASGQWFDRLVMYSKSDQIQALTDGLLFKAAKTYPIMIGEVGMALDSSYAAPDGTPAAEAERLAFANFLQICNENNFGYVGWWFRPHGTFRLVQAGIPGYVPTESGAILINYMRASDIPPPTPQIPRWLPTLLQIGSGIGLVYIGRKSRW